MNRLEEIAARLAAIANEVDSAEGEALTALDNETDSLIKERDKLLADVEARKALRGRIANGTEPGVKVVTPAAGSDQRTAEEREGKDLLEGRSIKIGTDAARSVLVSGGTLATPTEVKGINDIKDAKHSSIIDMVKVVNCEGMSTNRVAYISADIDAAAAQTEGSAATGKEPTFAYVDITPTSIAVTAQISKQAKKQTPLAYKNKITEQALISLRKKAAALVTASLKSSILNSIVEADLDSSDKGVINEKTLRKLVLAYGGDEGVGAGVLFLNKSDLIAFGDVRGTNEKRAIYKITPDGSNPNIGTIEEGGLVVKYCLNSGLTACSGTEQDASTGSDKPTMFYGDPMALELDLFSDYEVRVSEDFAFTSLMDTIRGDVEAGAAVVVKNGFVALTIKKASA